jgi:hypothetical protein
MTSLLLGIVGGARSADSFAQRHQVARSNTQRDLSCEEDPTSPVLLALISNPLKNREAILQ